MYRKCKGKKPQKEIIEKMYRKKPKEEIIEKLYRKKNLKKKL